MLGVPIEHAIAKIVFPARLCAAQFVTRWAQKIFKQK